jgi:hypothetical protein
LKENQVLLDQYNAEKDQESESILIKYIDLLNQTTKAISIPLNVK